jgi:hypothetical protein
MWIHVLLLTDCPAIQVAVLACRMDSCLTGGQGRLTPVLVSTLGYACCCYTPYSFLRVLIPELSCGIHHNLAGFMLEMFGACRASKAPVRFQLGCAAWVELLQQL